MNHAWHGVESAAKVLLDTYWKTLTARRLYTVVSAPTILLIANWWSSALPWYLRSSSSLPRWKRRLIYLRYAAYRPLSVYVYKHCLRHRYLRTIYTRPPGRSQIDLYKSVEFRIFRAANTSDTVDIRAGQTIPFYPESAKWRIGLITDYRLSHKWSRSISAG